ncbi:hypothetical protein TRIATDRAFT_321974 [Trichoderma atroviride IMI 206040]|uniref:VWFA domain-containing protein n=1 Tax=Hypocrea atroviridis (strain ATCC 20476 / IMI 206040) TaxID=452589 RepID=G9P8U4_HYPAI|nr:uncharacterized protein TRIATDRAFT_321974 [Trichoderma atroviride IMI 206040]EHK41816.1 hypothetical protein TRIATDRAFT_321974 [Trichoderma atroviride IMI 206040]
MDRLQEIIRFLTAAGGTPSRDGNNTHFTFEEKGSIRMRTWTGSELIEDELIADEVRPGTSAPIVNGSHKRIFVVHKDSSIKCFIDPLGDGDQVEEDEINDDAPWNEEKIAGVDTQAHPQSQLAVSYDRNTVFVFYQKPDGTLGCLNEYNNQWKDVKLPAVAALDGTPLATCNTNYAVFLFYISTDGTVRYLENREGKWNDVFFSAAKILDPKAERPGSAFRLTVAEDRQPFERIRPLVFCLHNDDLSIIKCRSKKLDTIGRVEGTEFVPCLGKERNKYYFWSPYPFYTMIKRRGKDLAQATISKGLWKQYVKRSTPPQESSATKHLNGLQEPFVDNSGAPMVNNNKTSATVSLETAPVQAIFLPRIPEQRKTPSGIPAQNSVFAGLVRFTDPFNLMGRFFGNGHNDDATQEASKSSTASRDMESDHISNVPLQANGSEMNGREGGTIELNGMDTSTFETEEVRPREAESEEPKNEQDKVDGTEAEEALVRKDEQEADSEGTEEETGSEGTIFEDAETAPSEVEEVDLEEDQSQVIQPEEAQIEDLQTKDLQTKDLQTKERQPEECQPEIVQNKKAQNKKAQNKDLQTEVESKETHIEIAPTGDTQGKEVQAEDAQTEDAQAEDAQTEDVQTEDSQTEDSQTEDAQFEDAQFEDAQFDDARIKGLQTKEVHFDDIQDKQAQNEEFQTKEPQTKEAPTKEAEIKDSEVGVEPEELENERSETSDFEPKELASKSVKGAETKAEDAAETSTTRTPAMMTRAAKPTNARRPTAKPKAETAVAGGSGKRSDTEESESENSDSEDSDCETPTHSKGKGVDYPDAPVPARSRLTTQKAIREDITKFIDESELSSFFSDDPSYLDTVVKNASKYKKKKKNKAKNDAHVQSIARLNIYQPVLYCDDSTSMRDVPLGYGTSLQFINLKSEDVHNNKLTYNDVKKKIDSMRPHGNTRIGTNLYKKILKPLVYDVINSKNRLKRPIFISCITDGCPSGESTEQFKEEILKCVRFLDANDYPRSTVRFQISQIGNDPRADGFLEELRGEILRDPDLKEVLYCTAERLDEKFEELKKNEEMLEQWLLRTLVMPLMGERINTLNFNN